MRANYQFILSLLCRPFASRQFISWEIFTCTYVYTVLISSLGPNKLCFRYEEFQRWHHFKCFVASLGFARNCSFLSAQLAFWLFMHVEREISCDLRGSCGWIAWKSFLSLEMKLKVFWTFGHLTFCISRSTDHHMLWLFNYDLSSWVENKCKTIKSLKRKLFESLWNLCL